MSKPALMRLLGDFEFSSTSSSYAGSLLNAFC